ncbi:MAG: hypothetical protein ACUZ8H_03880, partial [Candidatus Anammoxibacter sp.]
MTIKEFISDEEVEKAVHYLVDSAKKYAEWRSRMKFLEKHKKSIRAAEALAARGKTISENNIIAEASEAYKNALEDYETSVYEYELINAYRNAAETKIDIWK